MKTLNVEYLPLASLIPFARNARTHSDTQVAAIAGSIRAFGWTNPVIIDKGNGIIAGHGRVLAAHLLEMDRVPCIRLTHLSEPQKRALILADNKLALNAGWDPEMLRLELQELSELDIDLSLTGFSDLEVGSLLSDLCPDAETPSWDGMPEFTHEDQESEHHVIVHFASMADFHDFQKQIGQTINEKRKFIWYPEVKYGVYRDKEYVSDGGLNES